jgi:cysteine synthase
MKYENLLDAIGDTPIVRLNRLTRHLQCSLYAKLEFMNPGGSVKDRIAKYMALGAEKCGAIELRTAEAMRSRSFWPGNG